MLLAVVPVTVALRGALPMVRPSELAGPLNVTLSSKVTVKLSVWPTPKLPSSGTAMVPATDGATPSIRTPLESSTLFSVSTASLPDRSRIVPLPRWIWPMVMPSVSRSPG